MLDIFDTVPPRGMTSLYIVTTYNFDNRLLAIGWTYTAAKLKFLLNRCIKRLDDAVGKPEYAEIKPVDIIVVTDGAPSMRY